MAAVSVTARYPSTSTAIAHAVGGDGNPGAHDARADIERMSHESVRTGRRDLAALLEMPCRPDSQRFTARTEHRANRERRSSRTRQPEDDDGGDESDGHPPARQQPKHAIHAHERLTVVVERRRTPPTSSDPPGTSAADDIADRSDTRIGRMPTRSRRPRSTGHCARDPLDRRARRSACQRPSRCGVVRYRRRPRLSRRARAPRDPQWSSPP